jgi:hypothetical protein
LSLQRISHHTEPLDCERWSGDMLGYSGLHDVRRFAAYLDCGKPLPPPSTGEASNDSCLKEYYAAVEGRRPNFFRRILGSTPHFPNIRPPHRSRGRRGLLSTDRLPRCSFCFGIYRNSRRNGRVGAALVGRARAHHPKARNPRPAQS